MRMPPESATKQTRGQRRYSELTHARDEATKRAEAAERRAAELEARFSNGNGAGAGRTEPAPSSSTQQAVEEPKSTRPEPSEDEIGTKYKTYAEFTRDQARWVNEQEQANIDARIRAGIEADRASRGFNDLVEKVISRGREAYPDFDAVRTSGPGAVVPMPRDRIEAIFVHPASEHLQYVIAKDAALAQRLANCHPYEFGAELARLTPTGSGASPASPAVSATTTAPAPYQPVGSGSKTAAPSSAQLIKGFDFDKSGYRERRAAERAGRRR